MPLKASAFSAPTPFIPVILSLLPVGLLPPLLSCSKFSSQHAHHKADEGKSITENAGEGDLVLISLVVAPSHAFTPAARSGRAASQIEGLFSPVKVTVKSMVWQNNNPKLSDTSHQDRTNRGRVCLGSHPPLSHMALEAEIHFPPALVAAGVQGPCPGDSLLEVFSLAADNWACQTPSFAPGHF